MSLVHRVSAHGNEGGAEDAVLLVLISFSGAISHTQVRQRMAGLTLNGP